MPLRKGSSRKVIGENIKEMEAAGHPRNQSIAASLKKAGKSKHADADLGPGSPVAKRAKQLGTESESGSNPGHQVNHVAPRSTFDQERDAKFERASKRG